MEAHENKQSVVSFLSLEYKWCTNIKSRHIIRIDMFQAIASNETKRNTRKKSKLFISTLKTINTSL